MGGQSSTIALADLAVNLIAFDPHEEVIVKWTSESSIEK
jgi:hypothetical protein